MATATPAVVAPPSVFVTIGAVYVRRSMLGVPDLCVWCDWCERTTNAVNEGCMCCLPVLRRLQPLMQSEAWLGWRETLFLDLSEKWVVADWLEEQELPYAADRLRLARVHVCKKCGGTGRVRNRWKTTYPHQGEPCNALGCVRGKVIRFPPLWRTQEQKRVPYMTDETRQRLRALQDRWLALPTVIAQTSNYGWDHTIAGVGSPTFRQVRETVLGQWEQWFAAFFEDM